ncbi:prepilin peptidase [Salinicoccus jeotgali]|uniref:prepilin peptidase n=1 Tax=Salinicoccus jeotgali TaxID=381634 RepID=UPI0031D5A9F2
MFFIIILGGICASFIYAVTASDNISILYRRSRCDLCFQSLKPYELIPVMSFILLKGKCSYCKGKIDNSFIVCEILVILLYLLPIYFNLSLKDLTLYYLMITILLPLSIYDRKNLKIPNHMNLIFLVAGLFLTDLYYLEPFQDICIILILHLFFYLFSESIGYGDIKLFTVITLITPVNFFIYSLLLTYLIGGLFVIILHFYKTKLPVKIPLVPFITTAIILSFLLYDDLNSIYFGGFL